jgi:uncharacterized protein with LGFP repeats
MNRLVINLAAAAGLAFSWPFATSLPAGAFQVFGEIGKKYAALGGERGPLGPALSDESPAPNGGRFNQFQNGFIYWHPKTGAFAVWGAIAGKWNEMGRTGFGYPITDEMTTPDGKGRYNHFRKIGEKGEPETSIYWTPQTGARAIYGDIRKVWAKQGFERGALGYPTSDELKDGDLRRANFQGGFILWSAKGGAAVYTPQRVERCNAYARTAVKQSEEFLMRGCGPQDKRWQTNFQNHFNFCIGPDGAKSDSETRNRSGTLSQCATINPLPPQTQPGGLVNSEACSYTAVITNQQCLNLDGSSSSVIAPGTVTSRGCGATPQAALDRAKVNFSVGFGQLSDQPSPGACTYSTQVQQGCGCP